MENDLNDILTRRRLPDFIIAGAMKSGTSSLHKILTHHPDIFIPDMEIFFYNIDDLNQHPEFFLFSRDQWYYPHLDERLDKYLDWYEAFFADASEDQLLGEDTTTYLASEKAPERISKLNPLAKIIVMLRDPASRTYSHYWHLVRSGRAIYSFEDSLQIMQENLIRRSLYKQQINRFFQFIPYEQFHFVLFEKFIKNMQAVIEDACKFLGVSSQQIDLNKVNTRHNIARIPWSPTLQLWRNRLLRIQARTIYLDHLIEVPNSRGILNKLMSGTIDSLHRLINPLQQVQPPAMKESTRKFLNSYFAHENRGLSELIKINVEAFWYKD